MSHTPELVNLHIFGDELSEILVGSGHKHLETMLFGLVCEGAYHIVGLVALAGGDGDVESRYYLADIRQGKLYVFGHGVAVGLVFGKTLVAESGGGQVESHRDMRRFLTLYQLEKRGCETHYCRGVESFGGDARVAAQCVVGTISYCHTVEQ